MAAFLLTLLIVSSSDDKPMDPANPVGRHTKFDSGRGAAAHVWHDDSGWHLRFRGHPNGKARFQGKVVLDDEVPQLRGGQKEKNDKITRVPGGFGFDFHTTNHGFDSLDFYVPKAAKRVTFEIKITGNDNPNLIFIGAKGAHPKSALFNLPAHPESK